MAVGSLTGEAVAQMEADLHEAHDAVIRLQRQVALLEMDNASVKDRNRVLQYERDDAVIQCAEMRAIMEQVSAGLVSGLSRMKQTKRGRQERQIEADHQDDPPPSFSDAHRPAPNKQVDHAAAISEKLLRPQTIDENLADQDPRLPKLGYPEGDPLVQMHNLLGTDRRTTRAIR